MVQRKVSTIKRVIRDNDARLVRALVGRLNQDQDAAGRPPTPRHRLERIRDAINDLPASWRAAFVMHRFEGRSYGEIAATLGVSRTVVETYVARALDRCQSSARP